MTFETIETEVRGRIGILSFNRPQILNAINLRLMREVTEAMNAFAKNEDVAVIVVRGNGRAFSAGFDMKESAEQALEGTAAYAAKIKEQFEFQLQFWDSPKTTIACVHGFCLAGAFELALACDMTVAAEGTRLGEPEVRFGAGISALLLPWLVNHKIASELLLTGDDQIDAQRALDLGIVNAVVPQGKEFDKALALAHAVAASAQAAVHITRRGIKRTFEIMGMRQALLAGLDADIILASSGSPEREEFARIRKEKGLKAALEWRDAKFR